MQAEFIHHAEQLKADGVISDYIITNSNNDTNKQISDVRDLITMGVDGICLYSASPTALVPAVEEAYDAGIKVVSFDCLVETDKQVCTLGIDENEFGKMGAEFLVDKLGGKGKIVVLNGNPGVSVNGMRWGGAKAVFDQYPDIEILAEGNADWDYAKGKAAMESLLSAYPEIDGVYSQGGAMTQGAIDAFLAAGRPLVPMPGENNNGFLRQWANNKENGFDSIAPVNSPAISAKAADIVVGALNGETYNSHEVWELGKITAENFDEYFEPDMPDSLWLPYNLNADELATLFKEIS